MKNIIILIIVLTCFCGCSETKEEIPLITVEQLLYNLSKYETKTVDVYGEIIDGYHGAVICDENEESCLGILINVPDYKLRKDDLYYEYRELSRYIGGVQKQIGKAKLMATLRGQVYYYTYTDGGILMLPHPPPAHPPDLPVFLISFALQQVLELDIREGSGKPDWEISGDPAEWEKALSGNLKDK